MFGSSSYYLNKSRGLAAYSVMPANEASGIGGWSYGRIALYLLRSFEVQICNSLYGEETSSVFASPIIQEDAMRIAS